jgi:hypothetical protein
MYSLSTIKSSAMKSLLPLLFFALLFGSCTTAYKSGQTPDDVYYSPARQQQQHDEYVRAESRQPRYQYDEQSEDDRYLRMKVRNRRIWSDLDYYYNDPLAYSYRNRFNNNFGLYYNTPWNYYSSWNYYYNPYSHYYNHYNPYYNPYGPRVVVVTPRAPVYNQPRRFNLNTYNPAQNDSYGKPSGTRRTYRGDNGSYDYNTGTNTNTNRDRGSSLRNIFNNNNSNSSTQQSTPMRSDRSSTAPSNPSPSRSSNAPVRRF